MKLCFICLQKFCRNFGVFLKKYCGTTIEHRPTAPSRLNLRQKMLGRLRFLIFPLGIFRCVFFSTQSPVEIKGSILPSM